MKTELKSFMALGVMLASLIAYTACSKDDVGEESPPPDVQSLILSSSTTARKSGTGEGTAESPLISTAEQPSEITLSQKCTYNDPDGTIYLCEPHATVKLTVAKTAVDAKSITELTTIQESSTTTAEGTDTLTKNTVQTFTIGEQTLTFDLKHEIYTYTDSHKRTVPMPYLRPNNAHHGAAQTQETRAICSGAVTGIRLTPLSTRGSVTTQQGYHVSVDFTVEVQTENTKEAEKQTLSFTAEYDATVETITEFADPTILFSYHADAISGSASTSSPWLMSSGASDMTIQWDGQATYTYFDVAQMATQVISQEPKVTVRVSTEQDTLRIETLDVLEQFEELPSVEETEGENPTRHITKQSFNVCGKIISLDGIYESYSPIERDGAQIQLPYLELSKAEIVKVGSHELQGVPLSKPSDKAYEVTVRFRQSLTRVNTPDEVTKNVEYVVKFPAVLDNKLISTTYEKDYKWYDAHDNMANGGRYILRRIRTYASGEKIEDTFVAPYIFFCSTCPATHVHSDSMDPRQDFEYQKDGVRFVYSFYDSFVSDDLYTIINYFKTGVPDISLVRWDDRKIVCDYASDLSAYWLASDASFLYNPDNPTDGWYVYPMQGSVSFRLYFLDYQKWILKGSAYFQFQDHFLCLDGQVFDFPEYMPTYEKDFREEPITLEDGTPAKVFTFGLKTKYLDHDFYTAVVDTVYQLPQ